jgi:hypothetical protein
MAIARLCRMQQDLFDAMEPDIDGVKFAGGAVMAMQRPGVASCWGWSTTTAPTPPAPAATSWRLRRCAAAGYIYI